MRHAEDGQAEKLGADGSFGSGPEPWPARVLLPEPLEPLEEAIPSSTCCCQSAVIHSILSESDGSRPDTA